MDLSVKGKTFMVAAASKGLGFAIAETLAQEGAAVSLASRNERDIRTAGQTLKDKYGVKAAGYQFEATDAVSIIRWTESTAQDFGSIDGLVVNAGGLGQLMDQSMKMLNGGEASTILLTFLALVIVADALSAVIRRVLS